MLDSLARFVYRRRRFVAVGAVAFFVVAAGFGSGVASHLDPYGADDPATDSVKADNLLTDHGYRPTDVIVLFQHAPVASAQTKSRVEAVEHELRARGDVARVTGYYDTRSTRLRLARPRRDLPRRGTAADRRQGAPGRGVQHRGPAQRQARRHGRRRRAGPGAGQQADRVRPAPRRAARVPAAVPALAAVLPQPGRLAPAAARRRPRDRRHLPDPEDRERGRLDLDLRPQPDHRPRPRPGDRLQPVHRLPLPRGARQARRRLALAPVGARSAGRRCARPCEPRAARCCSRHSPSPQRSRR